VQGNQRVPLSTKLFRQGEGEKKKHPPPYLDAASKKKGEKQKPAQPLVKGKSGYNLFHFIVVTEGRKRERKEKYPF